MPRYLKVQNIDDTNTIVGWRTGTIRVDGEIEDIPNVNIGWEFRNGEWKEPLPKQPTYEETRQNYIRKIQESETLGEVEEVQRLRREWQQLKANYRY